MRLGEIKATRLPLPEGLTPGLSGRKILAALPRAAPHIEFAEEPEFPEESPAR